MKTHSDNIQNEWCIVILFEDEWPIMYKKGNSWDKNGPFGFCGVFIIMSSRTVGGYTNLNIFSPLFFKEGGHERYVCIDADTIPEKLSTSERIFSFILMRENQELTRGNRCEKKHSEKRLIGKIKRQCVAIYHNQIGFLLTLDKNPIKLGYLRDCKTGREC